MSLRDNLKTEKAKERYDRNCNSVEITFTQKELEEHDREIRVKAIDESKAELSAEIMKYINTGNRNNADYFIVDQIEELCSKYLNS